MFIIILITFTQKPDDGDSIINKSLLKVMEENENIKTLSKDDRDMEVVNAVNKQVKDVINMEEWR